VDGKVDEYSSIVPGTSLTEMMLLQKSMIGPWIDLIENNLTPFSCILSLTNSTTSAGGWLKKSNFKENNKKSKEMTASKLKMSRDPCIKKINGKQHKRLVQSMVPWSRK
jgi:hypothetical protein